jgi:hypothetical protein
VTGVQVGLEKKEALTTWLLLSIFVQLNIKGEEDRRQFVKFWPAETIYKTIALETYNTYLLTL